MTVHPETLPYRDAFAADAAEPVWLQAQRQAALARFGELGFPTRRQEPWRFTDLRALQAAPLLPAGRGGAAAAANPAPWRFAGAAHRIVLVDGVFAPALSDLAGLPADAWFASTARTLAERPELLEPAFAESDRAGAQPFAALNAACFTDGFVLALEPGTKLARPVEVIHLGGDRRASYHLRSLVQLGTGGEATLVESFAGPGAHWTNAVLGVRLDDGASLAHVRLQDESADAIHFSLVRAEIAAGARYRHFALTLGARLSRHEVLARLAGEGALCNLDGAYLLRGEQDATVATFADHAAPGGTTSELFKGVLDDRAHGAFLGRIAVRPDAQRTDAQQTNRNLLLSRRASVDTKPELEILADDVKCSHGATVGDLDEEALFYLRARGIAEPAARRMLIEAFAAETLDRVADDAVRGHLANHLGRWLAGSAADA